MKEALWYEAIENQKVQCRLCLHNCIIAEGRYGVCKVRMNTKGKLYSMTDKIFLAEGYDPIEKKPLAYFHPGSIIYSLGTAGCNFHCDFCQNWKIAQDFFDLPRYELEDEEVLRRAALEGSTGIAFTYNEPTMNFEAMLRLAKKAKKRKMITVAVSNGSLNEGPMKELAPFVDAWNIDLKMMNPEKYKKICGGDPEVVFRNIKIAKEHGHVEVTNLLIDGVNTAEEEIEELVKRIAEIGRDIPVHFSRYFPSYKRTDPPTKLESLYKAREIAEKYLDHIVLGNIPLEKRQGSL